MHKRFLVCLALGFSTGAFCPASVAQDLTLAGVPVPPENPVTESKRVLGKILFWEEQLSTDDSVACGTCHKPAAGGADNRPSLHPGPDLEFDTGNETIGSPGIPLYDANLKAIRNPHFGFAPQVTRRASQSVLTAMYARSLFWDGRAREQLVDPLSGDMIITQGAALESQALVPIISSNEMGHINRSWGEVTDKLAGVTPLALAGNIPAELLSTLQENPDYPALFRQAFGDSAITPVRIAMAIATYERTLVPDQSPFDRYVQGNQGAMTENQIEGWELFRDSVCSQCHTPPLFSNNAFARTGLRTRFDDNGLQVVTKDTDDFGLFKVPSLRNVGLRNALTHVGWITGVQDAIDFYNAGTQDTGHTLFTDGLSRVADPDNPGETIRMDEIDFFGNEPEKQALVVDFLSNALTDPRAAGEAFPFDRPILGSERFIAPTTGATGSVETRAIVNGRLSPGTIFSANDRVSLNQSLSIEPVDIGKAGNLYIVVAAAGKYFMRIPNGSLKPWSGKAVDLLPVATRASLSGTELLSVIENIRGLSGTFRVFTGYSANGGIIYSRTPYRFTVN